MRVFQRDVSYALNALRFMTYCAGEKAPYVWAEAELSRVMDLAEEEVSLDQAHLWDEHRGLAEILVKHEDAILSALGEYRREWQGIARRVAATKGWMPTLHREESGNAYSVSAEVAESIEYLTAFFHAVAAEHAHA
jgi:hypothetical protein